MKYRVMRHTPFGYPVAVWSVEWKWLAEAFCFLCDLMDPHHAYSVRSAA